jgi:uncharacterized iron-regulated membrane protein
LDGKDMMEMDELPVANPSAQAEVPPSAKMLLRAVYIMGIILVLLFLALVGGIIWKSTHKVEARAEAPQAIDLALPAGTSVQSMVLDGERLAVNTGAEIIVIDIRKNAVVSRIAIQAR